MRPRRNGRRLRRGGPPGTSTRVVRIPRNVHVIPDVVENHIFYSIKYGSAVAAPISAFTAGFLFSGNSIFNPDRNAVLENYPVGVPQMSQLYARYQVIGSTIRVRCTVHDAIANTSLRFAIYPHAYTSALPAGAVAVDDFIGQPRCSQLVSVGPVSGISLSRIATHSLTTSAMLSRPASQLYCNEDVSGFLATSTFQPNSQWFWNIIFSNSVDLLSIPLAEFEISINYHVRFYQPLNLVITNHATTGDVSHSFEPKPVCDCEEAKAPAP